VSRAGASGVARALVLVASLPLLVASCTTTSAEPGSSPRSSAAGPTGQSPSVAVAPGALADAACALPHRYLLRIWRGTFPGRSGQILLVPKEPNFLGTNFPHSGPWDYLQDVPLLWYGPGVVPARGAVQRPASIADIAPTQAKLLGFDLPEVDGRPLPEIPAPATPPRLIVTLVWDAGGMSVLDAFPHDWPNLKALIPEGVWYANAEVGSSPSITPATHATIGTGDYPMHTGQTDAEFFVGSEIVRAGALGPLLLLRPTLADLYDRAMGNRPLVGDLASVTWHLNMMSHGSAWGGGDRDLAVLRVPAAADNEGAEGTTWNLQGKNRPFFRFPAYVNDLPPLSAYTEAVDRADGALDGKWRDNSIEQFEQGWATPARIPYQERMVEEVIAREGFGADDVPDLLFINFKAIDHVSHIWSVNSPEMQDTLRWQDAALGDFVRFLDRQVGRGNYVLVLTADHGAQFDPKVSGAFQVTPRELQADLEAAFPSATDRPVFAAVRTSQVYLNEQAMRASGYTVEQIARWLLAYTKGQGAPGGPDSVPQAERDEPFFSAVIPTEMLPRLPCLPEARR
jgi:predicted AlkP superfamily pyrophosphatase or phosphodiesterase